MYRKTLSIITIITSTVFTLLVFVMPIHAANTGTDAVGFGFDPGESTAGDTELTTVDALTFLATDVDPVTASVNLINAALAFLGFIIVGMFLYAGFIWFRSGDNEEEIKKAKDIIVGTLIGLVLTFSAYGIAYLTFSQLSNITEQDEETYEASITPQ